MKVWLSFILVLLAVAASGRTRDHIRVDACGAITQRTGSQTDTPFLYNGAYGVVTDPNGLLYMQARYYNPNIRRFINADPSGFSGGMNFYAFAGGDPVSLIDPSGLGASAVDDAASYYEAVKFSVGMEQNLRPLVSAGLDLLPGISTLKAVIELNTGKDWVTGQWHDRSDGGLAVQAIVGAATFAPAFPAAGRAIGVVRAEAKISAAIRYELKGTIPSSGGHVRQFEQQGAQIYYRVFSGNQTKGNWLTAVPPRSRAWAREGLALPPWNKASRIQEVVVPDGTLLERSRAIRVPEWGRFRGGAEQFKLLQDLPDANFGPGRPLR